MITHSRAQACGDGFALSALLRRRLAPSRRAARVKQGAVRELVESRERHAQRLLAGKFKFAPDGENQACRAAGLGAFFEVGSFSSGIASACAAAIAARSR